MTTILAGTYEKGDALFPCRRKATPLVIISVEEVSYLTGISSNVVFISSQNGATDSMSARSVVVWGERSVGPSETTSMPGYLLKMTEHSNPA